MPPMFKKLFIDTDADDLAAEQNRRRRAYRSRRARQAMIIRPAARNQENRWRAVTGRDILSAHRRMGRLVMWCRHMSGCLRLRHDCCGLQLIHPMFGAHRVGRTASRAAG